MLSTNAGPESSPNELSFAEAEKTARLYGLPIEQVASVARHLGLERDAEGYFLDTFGDPPERLNRDEVYDWYVLTNPPTAAAIGERVRRQLEDADAVKAGNATG